MKNEWLLKIRNITWLIKSGLWSSQSSLESWPFIAEITPSQTLRVSQMRSFVAKCIHSFFFFLFENHVNPCWLETNKIWKHLGCFFFDIISFHLSYFSSTSRPISSPTSIQKYLFLALLDVMFTYTTHQLIFRSTL